ncbi:MAG TPA: GrpB family protein [Candidatus Binataceae bacterium]
MSGNEPWKRTEGVIARGPEIIIVEYDSRWPQMFEAEKARLMAATGDLFVELEHVGSSAVPGLAGKPVMDMLAAVRNLGAVEAHVPALANLGYVKIPFLAGRLFFLKRGGIDNYNIHIVPRESFQTDSQLLLRNYLRSHPEVAAEYARLKCEIVGRIEHYSQYSPAKSEFIQSMVDHACDERGIKRRRTRDTA